MIRQRGDANSLGAVVAQLVARRSAEGHWFDSNLPRQGIL